ncbi:hypothetical protein HYPSUDRAFT_196754 [Hypholoma sublateritium FD-334 SS-4]|uniref:Uncharacterized protein n=1 Tax=Hypholoma sublateritium (strain FD-334 SS-4) TaxID=945553 RepID=A0A0D2MZ28_HYPSF|nr:hypothetical protein HYPSUDRAFT_196754 [Hypholoma sublateritium FD-334 SS-4]
MLSRALLVVAIAVPAAVALIVLVAVLRVVGRRRRAARASPLPPVQALAHHRAQQLTKLDGIWLLSPPPPSRPKSGVHSFPVSSSHDPIPRMPRTPSSSRHRPLSVASSHSTLRSKSTRQSTVRGTPHGPHSQLQIVLPTPLAPTHGHHLPRRKSAVDQWVATD